jgi:hypothetical protein
MFEGADALRQALVALGNVLEDRGQAFELVAVGGGGLLLLGVVSRPTKDLDAIALVETGQYKLARPLPAPLVDAVEDVAGALGLANDWLNPGPTDQLKHGLPSGFEGRTLRHSYGGLTLHLASRFDQVCLKLYAATDDAPGGKHFRDLIALGASDEDLQDASAWVKDQDAGPEFSSFVDAVVAAVRSTRARR